MPSPYLCLFVAVAPVWGCAGVFGRSRHRFGLIACKSCRRWFDSCSNDQKKEMSCWHKLCCALSVANFTFAFVLTSKCSVRGLTVHSDLFESDRFRRKNMTHSRISSMTLAMAAAIALIGCGQKEEAKPAAPAPVAEAPAAPAAPAPAPEVTVKLGHVAPLTGPHGGRRTERQGSRNRRRQGQV